MHSPAPPAPPGRAGARAFRFPGCLRFRGAASVVAALLLGAAGALSAGCEPGREAGRGHETVAEVAGGDATRGAQLLREYGCNTCHFIPGVRSARGRVGPPLEGVGSRIYLAGRLHNSPETMIRWIRDPQGLVPGSAMPDLGVGEQDARDMAAYLYRQVERRRVF